MVGIVKAFCPSGLIVMMGLAVLCRGVVLSEETDPHKIIGNVVATYRALVSYGSDGTVTSESKSETRNSQTRTQFSIRLQKPDLYRISWRPEPGGFHGSGSGTVWNPGGQAYFYWEFRKAYSKMMSDESALRMANMMACPGGDIATIPSLFLRLSNGEELPLLRLSDLKLAGTEKIEGEECYIISGTWVALRYVLWVSTKRYLIIRQRSSYESPQGAIEIPEMTDQQIEEGLRSMGQEVTKERIEAQRRIMMRAREASKSADLKRRSTVTGTTYLNISFAEFSQKEFDFKPPAEVALVASVLAPLALEAQLADTATNVCLMELKVLGKDIMKYVKKHEGKFPECKKWCDELYVPNVSSRLVFLCFGPSGRPTFPASSGPVWTNYGFNEDLSGIEVSQVREPAKTVLLFEADRGQNVFGGRNRIISEPRHPGGFNFLFVDGHSETVPKQNLDRLVWMTK